MKKVYLVLASLGVLALLPFNASARIGETVEQCNQRYGKARYTNQSPALINGVPSLTYSYQGWLIKTSFLKKHAAMVRYYQMGCHKIQDDELQAVLKGEANGGQWKEKSRKSLNPVKNLQNLFIRPRLWKNSNGTIAYFETSSYSSLIIETPIVTQYKKAKAEAAEKKRKSSIPEF